MKNVEGGRHQLESGLREWGTGREIGWREWLAAWREASEGWARGEGWELGMAVSG